MTTSKPTYFIGFLAAAAALLMFLAPRPLHAEGIGIGAQAMLTGPGDTGLPTTLSGVSFTYDAATFYVDGILGLTSGFSDQFGIGGQFWYVMHASDSADLSVGGGLGIADDGDDDTDIHLQGGVKIRLFLASNVALSSVIGVSFIFDDDETGQDVFVGGQSLGSMGITYFF